MAFHVRRGTVSDSVNSLRHKHHAEFLFRNISIAYNRPPIGKGSYGEVRHAYCDTLRCAAKLIHAEFFDDPNFETLKRKFEEECELMSNMRHPNVIQYLGYYEEPQSRPRLPILLMELMDGSLTDYLDRHEGPIPFHTTVNFCHDIAMGLDYLHNNNMMHRDLSSNNVLLLGDVRAKITDFGQSQLAAPEENFRVGGDLHKCPGTQVYMPPEALRDPPEYSSMLDTFSFGVLMIQILTRKFPNPGPSTKHVAGVGRLPVKEQNRRHNDIATVNPKHPVLQLSLYCINDDENNRPLMYELCARFSEFKDLPEYKESVRKVPSGTVVRNQPDPSQGQRIAELTEQLRQLQTFMDNQEGELMQARLSLEKKDAEIKALQGSNTSRPTSSYNQSNPAPPSNPPPAYGNVSRLSSTNSPYSSLESSAGGVSSPSASLKSTSSLKSTPLDVPDLTLSDQKKMRWYPCTRTPVPMYGGSAVIFHNRAYVNGQGQNVVFEYNSDRNSWSQLPPTPTASFALVVANQMLTTVGGYTTQSFDNSLYSLMEDGGRKVWLPTLPPMREARVSPGAASSSNHIVVVGGEIQAPRARFLANSVEVYDFSRRQWSTAGRLPKPIKRVTMTLCDDFFIILGGVTTNSQPLTEVYYSTVSGVINSATQSELSRAFRGSADTASWQIAGTPLVYSCCAAVGKNVLAVGGWDNKASNGVYRLNPRAPVGVNPWSYAGQLAVPRFDCMVAVLPGDRMVVIGGRGQSQDTVLNLAEMAVPTA